MSFSIAVRIQFHFQGLPQAFVHREWGMIRESILDALVSLERPGQGASRRKPKSSWSYTVVPGGREGSLKERVRKQ